jgi:hypothetical protein
MVICGICEICVTQIPSVAGLYEEGADDGREDRDAELDDGLPGFHVFDDSHRFNLQFDDLQFTIYSLIWLIWLFSHCTSAAMPFLISHLYFSFRHCKGTTFGRGVAHFR